LKGDADAQGNSYGPHLGCGDGEKVMVATGSVAAAWFPGKPPPVDALIIGSIDESSEKKK